MNGATIIFRMRNGLREWPSKTIEYGNQSQVWKIFSTGETPENYDGDFFGVVKLCLGPLWYGRDMTNEPIW